MSEDGALGGELIRGHLDAVLLATVADRPLYGYAIIAEIRARTSGLLDLQAGSVYPALRRLERARYIEGTWSVVEGRRRRVYKLTPAGRRALAEQRTDWRRLAGVMDALLGAAPA